jgi:hypothetical protein
MVSRGSQNRKFCSDASGWSTGNEYGNLERNKEIGYREKERRCI